MVNSRLRFLCIRIIIFVLFFLLALRLFNMQILSGEEYKEISRGRLNSNLVEKAPRGNIYDRYGNTLVTNRAGYSLSMSKAEMTDLELNEMLKKLSHILEKHGEFFLDTLPISDYPFSFTFESDKEKKEWFLKNPYDLTDDMSAKEVMEELIHIYNISDKTDYSDARKIAGIRYEAARAGFSVLTPVVVAEDVGISVVSEIKERQNEFSCILVTKTYIREVLYPGYASHILGRTGKLTREEYEKYKDDGYSYSDVIGKQGIEKTAEKYLRGTDGTGGIKRDINGRKVTLIEKQPVQEGDSVVLTIDINMQKTVEDSLFRNISKIQSTGGEKTGIDADSGAAVVVDIKTGDVLACASYPTYNLNTFNDDYNLLLENDAKPLWNRAVSGIYTPGSTFKPLVAIAALETGKIAVLEKINDEGVYTFYDDYQPKCWIWQENHATHGNVSVSDAIKNSCNYFFYEAGRRTGIDDIDKYAALFGLGELTGIELSEETKGSVASPEYKAKVVKNDADKKWFGADTLQASIGQSYHAITPVQLANYAATIANGGTRYKLNLIKAVRNSSDNSIVYEREPTVLNSTGISQKNLNAVLEGMKNVVDEGSAYEIFSGYPVQIGGKTGTAQIGKKASNNAFFIAFAPFDEPEIAVCVAIEHGVRGANAAYVARDIFDYYFGL